MSAIAGIIRFDGAPVGRRELERMLASMRHRAPDRQGAWLGPGLGVAHGLLRVTEEDDFDTQPLHDPAAGLTLVADLRLDNREELASALDIPQARLRHLPDSAVLLAAYRKWQDRCVDRLLGDFAFAIWDGRKRQLMLAGDHMGQRGAFFHHSAAAFVFATEIRALLTIPGVPRVLSEGAIARRLMFGMDWPVGETHLEGIRAIGGGRALTIDAAGGVSERVYWTPHADPAHAGRDESYFVATYRRVLEEAVACRLRRLTRPAALFMSGGFDSAAIAGLAAPVVSAQKRKLITLSAVAPEGHPSSGADPRPWIEICGRFMPHLDIRVDAGNARSLDDVEDAFLSADGPVGLGFYVDRNLFKVAVASGARVVLDGMGGDYTMNPRGDRALAYFLRSGRWARFLREIGPHLRLSGHSPWRTLRGDILAEILPLRLLRLVRRAKRRFEPAWTARLVSPDFARRALDQGVLDPSRIFEAGASRVGMREECVEICRWMTLYPPSERALAAARHGLEHVRPFHDKRVVEFGLAIPEALYVKNGRNRYLACRALADVYPPEFQTRDRRQTSGAPDAQHVVASAIPRLLDEIRRLEARENRPSYVNLRRLRTQLETPRWETALPFQAAHTLLLESYVDWFAGDNT